MTGLEVGAFPAIGKQGKPLTHYGVKEVFLRLFEKAGIGGKKAGPYAIRHTFATWYLRNGGGVRQLQEILGHQSIETTMIYVHLADLFLVGGHDRELAARLRQLDRNTELISATLPRRQSAALTAEAVRIVNLWAKAKGIGDVEAGRITDMVAAFVYGFGLAPYYSPLSLRCRSSSRLCPRWLKKAMTRQMSPMVASHWSGKGLAKETRPTAIRVTPMMTQVFVALFMAKFLQHVGIAGSPTHY